MKFTNSEGLKRRIRLTPRKDIRDKIVFSDDWQTNEICKKCCELEDIEEELGIDMITLFKVFRYGFWFKEEESLMTDNEKERFKRKHYIDYDSKYKLMFQSGLDRIKENCYVPIVQLSTTILNDKIEYFLIAHSAIVLLKDYGKTWALTREELKNEK